MATPGKEISLIEKLHNSNYDNWSFKLEMLLIKDDLFHFITEGPPSPQDDKWLKGDAKVRATINLCIDDAQIIHVKNLQTSKQIWQTLKCVHQRSTLSSKLFLLRKLYSQKLSEGGDMNSHINNILTLRNKLSAIGEDIAKSHIVALLLCSIPHSYDALALL